MRHHPRAVRHSSQPLPIFRERFPDRHLAYAGRYCPVATPALHGLSVWPTQLGQAAVAVWLLPAVPTAADACRARCYPCAIAWPCPDMMLASSQGGMRAGEGETALVNSDYKIVNRQIMLNLDRKIPKNTGRTLCKVRPVLIRHHRAGMERGAYCPPSTSSILKVSVWSL